MKLPKTTEELLKQKDLVFESETSKEDWYLCTISKDSGFSMFKEEIRRDQVNKWVLDCLGFVEGKKKWVK